MDHNNKYTSMQKTHYEATVDLMNNSGNHRHHDQNKKYWSILLADCTGDLSKKTAFDFGCGQGRNIINMLLKGYGQVDGCDISAGNVDFARKNIEKEFGTTEKTKLYVTNGIDINGVASDYYDFVMSTIVMQHICVYEIRMNILKDKYRILKPGGVLSFQMGFDNGKHPGYTTEYYDNNYDAPSTNGTNDVIVTDPKQITSDLEKIGFKNITYSIEEQFADGHDNWIYVRAVK